MKPPIFRWYDFFTFGAMAIFATVCGLIATFNGLNDDVVWWRKTGLWLVVLIFWGGYFLVLKWRWDLNRRIFYVSKHGLMMIGDGGDIPFKANVDAYVENIFLPRWDAAFAGTPTMSITPREVLKQGVMVYWKEYPFELHKTPGKFAGFAKPWKNAIAVGSKYPVESTALGHELGHIVLHASVGDGSEDTLRAFSDKFEVPY